MTLICEKWEFVSNESQLVEIPPDGCRDIIFSISKDKVGSFHIYELANSTDEITIGASVFLMGFRLNPAAIVDNNAMKKVFFDYETKIDNITNNINEIARIDENISEALHFLGYGNLRIETCAKYLGVSLRSLQREVLRKTGKTPVFWQQLARARKSAKSLYLTEDLIETAYDFGYSDQSHFNREMKRWFNKTPRQIAKDNDLHKMLCAPAYF